VGHAWAALQVACANSGWRLLRLAHVPDSLLEAALGLNLGLSAAVAAADVAAAAAEAEAKAGGKTDGSAAESKAGAAAASAASADSQQESKTESKAAAAKPVLPSCAIAEIEREWPAFIALAWPADKPVYVVAASALLGPDCIHCGVQSR
jgi:hypothetical protein